MPLMAVGKTRLSRELKRANLRRKLKKMKVSEERPLKVLYYNAFTEDLFYWDNDLEGDNERKLVIQPNNYTDWVLQEQGQDQNAITHFQRYANDKLTPRFNAEYEAENHDGTKTIVKAFSEVTFSIESGTDEHILTI